MAGRYFEWVESFSASPAVFDDQNTVCVYKTKRCQKLQNTVSVGLNSSFFVQLLPTSDNGIGLSLSLVLFASFQ